jgi:hypothetical protein
MSSTLKDIDFDDFDDFDIDDSDPHNLSASPNTRSKSKVPTGANGTSIEPVEVNRGRMQESRLSAEESREAALRQELENVRKMNEVLEGVYSSLEKAKNNMEVIDLLSHWIPYDNQLTPLLDCIPHCNFGIDAAANMDAHPFANRAQSTTHSKFCLARRISRSQ